MGAEALLLLGEEILERNPARGRATGHLIDVLMMAMFGHARARTEAEFRALLDQAGFVLAHVIPTASALSLVSWHRAKP
jgi:hypothetical protein